MIKNAPSDRIIGYQDSSQPIGYLDISVTPAVAPVEELPFSHQLEQKNTISTQIMLSNNQTLAKTKPKEKQGNEQSSQNKQITASEQPKEKEQKSSKAEIDDHTKLNDLVNKQNRILYGLKTVFPLSFFPDEITIEDDKVNVVIRGFFASEEIRSSGIKDISHIEVETSLLFSTIVIGSKSFSDNSIKISGFWTEHAKKARRIIEGLRVIQAEEIDTSVLSLKELVTKAEELGTAQGVEKLTTEVA